MGAFTYVAKKIGMHLSLSREMLQLVNDLPIFREKIALSSQCIISA
jgi:hypothetical protein